MITRREQSDVSLARPLARPAAAAQPGSLARVANTVRRSWLLYLLLVPTFVFTAIFYYYPLASGIYHSFTYWDLKQTLWIGLENYQRMFEDDISKTAWRNMLVILGSQLVIAATAPLLVATLIYNLGHSRASYWWRVLFVSPIVVPATVTVFVWRWFYGPDGGLNQVLRGVGLDSLAHIWLGEQATALWAIIFVGFPWVSGLNFLLYLAALQSIPSELIDAARVDGAGPFRRFFQIELPLIRPQMMLLLILTFIYYLRSFDAPLIMTNGGPGRAGTMVPGLQMYHAVREGFELGYGSAIGTVLFLVTIGLTLVYFVVGRRQARD
jgi:raffinose/stachyose/melibiose transport system permease protein